MKRLLLALILLIALLLGAFLWLGSPSTTSKFQGKAMDATEAPMAARRSAESAARREIMREARHVLENPPADRFIVCPGNPRCPPRQTTH